MNVGFFFLDLFVHENIRLLWDGTILLLRACQCKAIETYSVDGVALSRMASAGTKRERSM